MSFLIAYNAKYNKRKFKIMNRIKQWILYSVICRFWWRANAVLGYIFLLPIGYLASKEEGLNLTWKEVHKETIEICSASWNKY